MNYGLTIYGPLDTSERSAGAFENVVYHVFICAREQCETAWQTLLDFPDFNHVDIVMRRGGDLVIEVYYSPVDVPEDADCVFHAKISPGGTYA